MYCSKKVWRLTVQVRLWVWGSGGRVALRLSTNMAHVQRLGGINKALCIGWCV